MSVSTNGAILVPPLSSGEEFWATYKLRQAQKESTPQEEGSQEE